MKLLSVNTGSSCEVIRNGKKVQSGIFKQPIKGPTKVLSLGLVGDYQANKKLHGGVDKAICVYPAEHYDVWRNKLGRLDLFFGDFGENFTTIGLAEETVCLGDRFRIGSAEVAVTQPREPCVTLNARFGVPDLALHFKNSGRSGFYFSIVKEGSVNNGDVIECTFQDANKVSIAEFNKVLNRESGVEDIARRACEVTALPLKLKKRLLKQLSDLEN